MGGCDLERGAKELSIAHARGVTTNNAGRTFPELLPDAAELLIHSSNRGVATPLAPELCPFRLEKNLRLEHCNHVIKQTI